MPGVRQARTSSVAPGQKISNLERATPRTSSGGNIEEIDLASTASSIPNDLAETTMRRPDALVCIIGGLEFCGARYKELDTLLLPVPVLSYTPVDVLTILGAEKLTRGVFTDTHPCSRTQSSFRNPEKLRARARLIHESRLPIGRPRLYIDNWLCTVEYLNLHVIRTLDVVGMPDRRCFVPVHDVMELQALHVDMDAVRTAH